MLLNYSAILIPQDSKVGQKKSLLKYTPLDASSLWLGHKKRFCDFSQFFRIAYLSSGNDCIAVTPREPRDPWPSSNFVQRYVISVYLILVHNLSEVFQPFRRVHPVDRNFFLWTTSYIEISSVMEVKDYLWVSWWSTAEECPSRS